MLRLRLRSARRGSPGPAAARSDPGRGEHGSGTATGAAMMLPMLMLVIVLTQMPSDTTRSEQAPQAAANRAARTAALCCYRIDGAGGAVATVRAGLESVTSAAAGNRIYCNNNMAGYADVVFIDADDSEAAGAAPPGGTAHAFLTRRIPPQTIGGLGIPALDAERLLAGGHHRPLPLPHRHLTPTPAPAPKPHRSAGHCRHHPGVGEHRGAFGPKPHRSAGHCRHRSRETGRHSKSEQLLNRGFSVEPLAALELGPLPPARRRVRGRGTSAQQVAQSGCGLSPV